MVIISKINKHVNPYYFIFISVKLYIYMETFLLYFTVSYISRRFYDSIK